MGICQLGWKPRWGVVTTCLGSLVGFTFMSSSTVLSFVVHPGRISTSAIALASLLTLAGCGEGAQSDGAAPDGTPSASSSPSPVTPETPDPTDELKQAVQAYSDAFLTGDVKAYDLFSERCQDRTNKNEFIGILAAAKSAYGSALPLKSIDADVSGDLARVSYTYPIEAINQDSEPWVREGGTWKQDDC